MERAPNSQFLKHCDYTFGKNYDNSLTELCQVWT